MDPLGLASLVVLLALGALALIAARIVIGLVVRYGAPVLIAAAVAAPIAPSAGFSAAVAVFLILGVAIRAVQRRLTHGPATPLFF